MGLQLNSRITIITATTGRDSLQRTVDSVLKQDNSNWNYLIVFDGIEPTICPEDDRIKVVKIKKAGIEGTNIAGKVYNIGMNLCNTEYVGFLDDDDTIMNNYVSEFYKIVSETDYDEIIFKMIFPDGNVIPYDNYIDFANVGISFVLRRQFLKDKNIEFVQHETGDWYFWDWKMSFDVWQANGKIFFSDKICYKWRESC